ncbi:hypothetical protein ACIGO8_17115 [Streptomyces sp. NPDC053493]|uniref:phage baseplate protein n=1 Tax=Streptomyces sp. NPDC053493 TaxID=3365705 RepID=UPI0037D57F28
MIKLATTVRPTLVAAAPLDNAAAVAQSVYWESVDQLWYVCQLDSTVADQTRLIVSRFTADGVPKDKMYVEKAGHGANIGVERSDAGTFLWTDALPNGGWATGIARIPYVAGSTVDTTAPTTTTFKPRTGVYRVSATIDPTRRQLIYRWQSNDIASKDAVGGFDRYDLATAATGMFQRLQSVAFGASGKTLQGYTSLGDHVYQFYGDQEVDNATVTCTDWASGALLQSQPITDFAGLNNREPEGLCVYETAPGDPAATVAFAIAAKPATGRQINIARFPHAGTSPWTEVPFDTALYAPNSPNYLPQFRIDGDQVYVHFSLSKLTVPPATTTPAWGATETLFTLPPRARPNRTQRLVGVVSGSNISDDTLTVRFEVTTDGRVTLFDPRNLVGWVGGDFSFWLV